MKHIFTLLFSFCLLFNYSLSAEAKTSDILTFTSTYTEYISDDLYAEVELCIIPENTSTLSHYDYSRVATTYASTKQQTASKTYRIKNSAGTTIGSYTLTGTFQYNGSASACTKASYSTSVSISNCYFKSSSAYKSGNSAIGSFTFFNSLTGTPISKTLTLKCSANGTIQ